MRRLATVGLATVLALGLALACASAAGAAAPPTGEMVEGVKTLADPTETYTLYLPSAYDPKRPWPVLLIFDPRLASDADLGGSTVQQGDRRRVRVPKGRLRPAPGFNPGSAAPERPRPVVQPSGCRLCLLSSRVGVLAAVDVERLEEKHEIRTPTRDSG